MITKLIPDNICNSKEYFFFSKCVVRRQIDAKVTSPALFMAIFDFFTHKTRSKHQNKAGMRL